MKKYFSIFGAIFSIAVISANWFMSAPGKILGKSEAVRLENNISVQGMPLSSLAADTLRSISDKNLSAPVRILSNADAVRLENMPVLKGGRVMPLSSAAADTLRVISGKSSAKIDGKKVRAAEWLLYLNAFPSEAAKQKFFKTDNRELQNLIGASGRYFSFDDINAHLEQVYEGMQGAGPFAAACETALSHINTYMIAENALAFYAQGPTPAQTFEHWKALVAASENELKAAAAENRKPNQEILYDAYRYLSFLKEVKERENLYKNFNIYAIPDGENWHTPLDVMLNPRAEGKKLDAFMRFGALVEAVSKNDIQKISETIALLEKDNPPSFRQIFESAFNRLDIFTCGAILYLLSFVFFALSAAFKKYSENLAAAATSFLAFALACHAFGVAARMFIQMRPPVTNLYSSVIFTGLSAAAIGLFLVLKKRKNLYGLSTAPLGFLSILVALNLPYSGDTMGMMRAVLNSNFWLTTHIVPMMLGYCGVFLAGFAASLKLISNLFVRSSEESMKEAASSVYGILCFAMMFSFAGTMLGGIWADLSWGRFWGWDPKENGALMVVLWCALIVHCRALKIAGSRGILALACIGNVIAAWAWFGVNMMGVGLHSYGFMSSGKFWLILFAALQSAVALLALIPIKKSAE